MSEKAKNKTAARKITPPPTSRGLVPSALFASVGSTALLYVLQQPSHGWEVRAALVIVGGSFAVALWLCAHWAAEYYGRDQLFRGFPLAIAAVFVVMFTLLSVLLISSRQKDEDNARYRRIATGGGVPNVTTLTELTNSELRERATALVEQMRERSHHYEDAVAVVNQRKTTGELTPAQADAQINDIRKQCGREFEATIRSNMELTLSELRNRVPPQQRKGIPMLPQINPVDPGGVKLDLGMILPSDFCMSLMPLRAQEIEKLATLLPQN